LVVIVLVTIGLTVLGIIAASIICKRVRFCPLHHSKGAYSHSSTPPTHSAINSRYYQPVGQQAPMQTRHSATFTNLTSSTTPPQLNKPLVYDGRIIFLRQQKFVKRMSYCVTFDSSSSSLTSKLSFRRASAPD
jgi:hypothetical protein